MHYDGYSFSKLPILEHPTILDRETQNPIESQRVRPSVGDIQRICRLYSCEKCGGDQIECGNGQGNFFIQILNKIYLKKWVRNYFEKLFYVFWKNRACDGFSDCSNSFDEENCESCQGVNSWKCKFSPTCILKEQVCDGKNVYNFIFFWNI